MNYNLQTFAQAVGHSLFECRASYPKPNAQANLQGRTHYVDDDTLRYHKARIVSAREMLDGAFFRIVEVCALDYKNTKRGYRVILFDLDGQAVYRPHLDECRSTRKAAEKDFEQWLGKFNPDDYYTEQAERLAKEHERRAADIKAAAALNGWTKAA